MQPRTIPSGTNKASKDSLRPVAAKASMEKIGGTGGAQLRHKESGRPVTKISSCEKHTSFAPLSCKNSNSALGNKKKPDEHVDGNVPTALNEAALMMAGKLLTQYSWYHGLMPREECDELAVNDGDYLVRKTTVKKRTSYIVTVRHGGQTKHFPLNYDPKVGWELTHAHTAIFLDELLDKLVKGACPIGAVGAILKNPVRRPDYYILHEHISIETKIGAGAFGEVFSGKMRKQDGSEIAVAIKKIKAKAMKKNQIAEFMREAHLMRKIKHRNCIMMYGVAPQEEPLMIILELASGGTLKPYLKKSSVTVTDQVRLITDAARGMCYLSSRQVIHRDLAARNCLLGEMYELKISDFGLSANCDELKLTKLKNVPIKWLAPESLTGGVFNTKTDVWSFGVLTWEICTRCKSDPFPGQSNTEAKNIILGTGEPMTAPADGPSIAQEVMKNCFVRNPSQRYDFVQLLKLLAPDESAPIADVADSKDSK